MYETSNISTTVALMITMVFDMYHQTYGQTDRRGMVFQLLAEGLGVTLIDSTSLNEVAYFCADTLAPWLYVAGL